MSLQIENLRVNYGSTPALKGINLTLEPGELFFLLGPSGCGKSTLLRTVAGFIADFEGDIRINGQSLKGVPPHRRDFGMVFQNYALFPHLTVNGNVAFGLEARQVPSGERASRVAEALKMVGLAELGERRPGELSGGQQQRVALARALVIKPRLLLLDEPLSNLDAKLRWEMREEIRRIHKQTGITALYVTHDQKEALSLAGRMAVMRAGVVEALGPPRALYRNPPNRFSAEFLGDVNGLPGTITADGKSFKSAHGVFDIGAVPLPENVRAGEEAIIFCRPESVHIQSVEDNSPPPPTFVPLNITAAIASSVFQGESTLYEIDCLPGQPRWRALRHESPEEALADGAAVKLFVAGHGWALCHV